MDNVVYQDDKEYPELLKEIKGAPKQIYYKGQWDKTLFENCLAVIGSRKLTHYGQQAMERLVGEIALLGITIVSGFMYGGDAVAHQAAIKAGGRTIAVMPCGIERIHPEYQKELYQDILDNNGLIISEYKGDMPPVLWAYPQRNRIVAGLSKALFVAEAGEKSGCLITANYSRKFKRKIFVLPGPITSSVSKGSNMLIKEGAEMMTEAKDILDYYRSHSDSGLRKQNFSNRLSLPSLRSGARPHLRFKNLLSEPSDSIESSPIEKQILELLEREALGIDELSRKLGISSSKLGVKLSIMEIQGMIELRGDKYYAKNYG